MDTELPLLYLCFPSTIQHLPLWTAAREFHSSIQYTISIHIFLHIYNSTLVSVRCTLVCIGQLQNMSKHCGAEERMLAGECDEERVRRRFSAREPCLSSQRWNVRSSYEHASHEVHTPTRWPEQAEQMTCMGVISQKLSIVG